MTTVERYLELAVELGAHAEDLIDSYYGPVTASGAFAPAELTHKAAALLADVEDDPWLASQVRSLHTTARKLAGETLPYVEEVELTYGIRPEWRDESVFAEAHRKLDDALPGGGAVRERWGAGSVLS